MGTETVVKRYLNPTQNLELIITDTCNFLIEATRSTSLLAQLDITGV